eukprot:3996615-Alexandrium_andersonii.AAC.1
MAPVLWACSPLEDLLAPALLEDPDASPSLCSGPAPTGARPFQCCEGFWSIPELPQSPKRLRRPLAFPLAFRVIPRRSPPQGTSDRLTGGSSVK